MLFNITEVYLDSKTEFSHTAEFVDQSAATQYTSNLYTSTGRWYDASPVLLESDLKPYRISQKDKTTTNGKYWPNEIKDFRSDAEANEYLKFLRQRHPDKLFQAEVYTPVAQEGDHVWSVKDALKLRSVVLKTVTKVDDLRDYVYTGDTDLQIMGKDIFKTKEEAIAEAKKQQAKKANSLKKQLFDIESIVFE